MAELLARRIARDEGLNPEERICPVNLVPMTINGQQCVRPGDVIPVWQVFFRVALIAVASMDALGLLKEDPS